MVINLIYKLANLLKIKHKHVEQYPHTSKTGRK